MTVTTSYAQKSAVHWPHFLSLIFNAHRDSVTHGQWSAYKCHNIRLSAVWFRNRTLSWIGHSGSFKVILFVVTCQQKSVVIQMTSPLFLKQTRIIQATGIVQIHRCQVVNYPTLVWLWRQFFEKNLRIPANNLYYHVSKTRITGLRWWCQYMSMFIRFHTGAHDSAMFRATWRIVVDFDNACDFLLVFCSNIGHIFHRFGRHGELKSADVANFPTTSHSVSPRRMFPLDILGETYRELHTKKQG